MSTLILIDLDGTLLNTPHFEAWRNTAFKIGGIELIHEEYIDHIAGRPRMEGASRLLELKRDAQDQGEFHSLNASELAGYKQKEFQRLCVGTELFSDALHLLQRIDDARLTVIFYTASQNASDLFDITLRQSALSLKQAKTVFQQSANQTRGELFQQLIGTRPAKDIHLIDDSPYAVDLACSLGVHAWQIRRNQREPRARDPRVSILSSLDEFMLPK
ncbi:HAD family hydrolase [Pseudomonas jessenii]|uniref:HAD family hydrolase n=1 Tax=Pseudomonas jessenii TaxID=77298 RepID=UPI000FC382A1